MSIKETVTQSRFTSVLLADEYASWSYGATKALFDYYEELSEDIGEDIELDPVAIRCEWSEYSSAWEAMEQYQPEDMPTLDDSEGMDLVEIQEESEKLAREWLDNRTTILDVENTDFANHCTIDSILVAEF